MAPQDDAVGASAGAVPPLPFAQLLARLRQDKGQPGGR
jgi:hypothetical protein